VTQNGSQWTYSYEFTVPDGSKEISHVIIERSEGFNETNIISFSPGTDELELGFYSSPEMPGTGIFGLKWDLKGNTYV
jgi:hypothetical protein